MKNGLRSLLLLLGLFALTANSVWACNNGLASNRLPESSENSCCSKPEAQKTGSDNSVYQHSDTECPCDHKNGGCKCPDCGIICHSGGCFALNIPPTFNGEVIQNASVQRQAFYFAEFLPESVYLPIWQPPKLVA